MFIGHTILLLEDLTGAEIKAEKELKGSLTVATSSTRSLEGLRTKEYNLGVVFFAVL